MPEQIDLLTVVNSIGTLGMLVFMVLAFYRGDIVAKAVVDRILEVYEKRIGELVDRLMAKMDKLEQLHDKVLAQQGKKE